MKSHNIIDIEASYGSFIALSEGQQVFVWGAKMGIYPELNDLS